MKEQELVGKSAAFQRVNGVLLRNGRVFLP